MKLEARLIDVRREDDNTFSFAAEFYDTADPELVLFTSPRWARAVDTPAEDIDELIADYGREHDRAEETAVAFKDRTVEVIGKGYSPTPERIQAVHDAIAAAQEAEAAREQELAAREREMTVQEARDVIARAEAEAAPEV